MTRLLANVWPVFLAWCQALFAGECGRMADSWIWKRGLDHERVVHEVIFVDLYEATYNRWIIVISKRMPGIEGFFKSYSGSEDKGSKDFYGCSVFPCRLETQQCDY